MKCGRLIAGLFFLGAMIVHSTNTVAQQCDVCVHSGTSGGIAAAVQTARIGKRVELVEPGRHPVGMTAGGLSDVDRDAPRSVGGIARKYFTRLVATYRRELNRGNAFNRNEGPATRGAFPIAPHVAEKLFAPISAEAGVVVLRDANSTYHEQCNGIHCTDKNRQDTGHLQSGANGRVPGSHEVRDRDFPRDPYIVKRDSKLGLLPLVNNGERGTRGKAAILNDTPRSFGTFTFTKGTSGWNSVSNEDADGFVAVDGVQPVPADIARNKRRLNEIRLRGANNKAEKVTTMQQASLSA